MGTLARPALIQKTRRARVPILRLDFHSGFNLPHDTTASLLTTGGLDLVFRASDGDLSTARTVQGDLCAASEERCGHAVGSP